MKDMDILKIEDVSSIDNWKPTPKIRKIPKSAWRRKQIGNDFNQQPGFHDLKRIYFYLNNKYADYDIMEAFGISAEVLVAIKKGFYDPVEGIFEHNKTIHEDLLDINESLNEKEKLKIKAQSGKRNYSSKKIYTK